jgi:glycosyltransferase involved in cell wall biosynthesis
VRVCHVIESAAAGSAGIMLTLAERGVAAGQDVTVIYSPLRASEQFLERAGRLSGARFVSLEMRRSVGPHDIGAAAKLRAILRRERFDVVHSHSSKAGALARLAGIAGRSAQVYSPHGFVTMAGDASPVYRPIERVLGLFCDAIVAVSRKEKDHALTLGIADSKVVVVANGIQEELIADAAALPLASARFTVGFVGRFCDQKDPVLAIEAFGHLHEAFPQSRLVMIGGGEQEDEVRAKVAELGLGDSVELPGACAALPLYPQFDALLCSSRFEGMALTFLEALAHGVPIVSTDVGGVDELVDPGETGFVGERTATSLGGHLRTVAALDPAERLALREGALAKARAYSAQAMFDRTAALYGACLGRG